MHAWIGMTNTNLNCITLQSNTSSKNYTYISLLIRDIYIIIRNIDMNYAF